MASSMFIGVLFATRLPLFNALQRLPRFLLVSIGFIVILAGCWNVFWYAARNVGDFWGNAALIAGSLQILTGAYIAYANHLPIALLRIRSVVVLSLLCCGLLYAITIYNL
ncbi:MAG: hypothetical protein ACPG4U_10970 [Pseudomonadales bacterium]